MSKYTTELRFICEHLAGHAESKGYNDIDTVIEKTWQDIFSFSFPIYKETYRKELCTKIIRHFYTRELGYETYGRWKLALQTKMNEIMPYYNRLYSVVDEKFELLKSQDLHIEHTLSRKETMERDSDTTHSGTSEYQSRFLDTPQGGLEGLISSDYLTNVTQDDTSNTDKTSFEESGSGSTNENWDEYRYGYENPYDLLEKYTQERFNIDMSIIMELDGLFMSIW